MLKLNKKLEYALISLKHLDLCGRSHLCSAKEITLHYAIPFDVTSRVLQKLAQAGWLRSEQGPSGGYQIEWDVFPHKSLYELVEVIEGRHAVVKCLIKDKDCPILSKCNVMSPMEKLNEELKRFLSSIPVQSLLTEPEKIQEVVNV